MWNDSFQVLLVELTCVATQVPEALFMRAQSEKCLVLIQYKSERTLKGIAIDDAPVLSHMDAGTVYCLIRRNGRVRIEDVAQYRLRCKSSAAFIGLSCEQRPVWPVVAEDASFFG